MSLKWTEVSSTFNIEAYNVAVVAVGAHARIQKGLPMSFVKGVQLENVFLMMMMMMGKRILIALKAGHQRPASETFFKWRFAGGQMIDQNLMLAW